MRGTEHGTRPHADPARWQRMQALFDAAVALAPAERAAHLARECADDDALRADVERLLRAHDRAGDFIARPALESLDISAAEPTLVGQRLGPYHLIREIGQGGMGLVYLGERSDEQFHQRVAVKVIRRGMDTELVLRRFRAERQILASLEHPNIARLLDGGTTDTGLPYLVMEYIDGEPLDTYVRSRALPIAARLELFLQVCGAVSYAHRHLVVHRDIKPLNILVTAEGVPKLLDFGIARILDTEQAGPVSTIAGMRLLTPEYASPEQADGAPVTTASDVYSLGVVLYELLTGQLPHRFASRTPAEVARTIRTTQPARPSSVAVDDAPDGDTARLRRRLRGDLDTIVLTALRDEPERRYHSVDRLAEDVRRHLASRPVLARPDTLWYRASTFARRNAAATAAGLLALLAVVGGTAAVAWQAREARAQAAVARAEAARASRRFAEVRKLAHALLFDYHDAIRDLPGATPVRARLVRDGVAYLDTLAREAGGDMALQRELADGYLRVADVQGGTMFANLGDTRGAMASYMKAARILEASLRAEPRSVTARRALARADMKLGNLLWETGDVTGGLAKHREALAILRSLAARAPADVSLRVAMEQSEDYIGMILLETGDAAGSLHQHETALGIIGALPDSARRDADVRRGESAAWEHAGAALLALGRLDDALADNARALELRATLAREHPLNADYQRMLQVSYYNEGEILARIPRAPQALESYRRSADIARSLMRADPSNEQYRGDLAYADVRVADMLAQLGRPAEALARYREAGALRGADVRADSANLWKRGALIETRAKSAKVLAALGRSAEARDEARATRALMTSTVVAPTNALFRELYADTYVDLGDALATLARHGDPARAALDCAASRELYRAALGVWSELTRRGLMAAADTAKPRLLPRRISECGRR